MESPGQPELDERWSIDSGCSNHVSGIRSYFTNYQSYAPGERTVNVADKRNLVCQGIGTVEVIVCLPQGTSCKVAIENDLHVEDCRNLQSLGQLMERGLEVKIEPAMGCHLFKAEVLMGTARMQNRRFLLDTQSRNSQNERSGRNESIFFRAEAETDNKDKRSSQELWHRRLGRISYDSIRTMKEVVVGMRVEKYSEKERKERCEDCVRGSLSCKPFAYRQHTATKVLQHIHSDVCGPVETASLGKGRYFLLFTDEYTRYTTGYFMQHKSEAFDYFLEFKADAEKATGKKIQSLRSDGGGKYQSKKFLDCLRIHGIRSACTTPYTPQENGIAERQNRRLMNKVLSMMSSVSAPKVFWVLACETAIYLPNRSPCSPLKGKTPYELWFGKMPNISHLRVCGCKVMYRVPKEHRKKLDYKATGGVFVGYCLTSKHYKIYDPKSHRLITSRDVILYKDCAHWRLAVEIPSEKSASKEEKHVQEYGLEDLFGKGLETEKEEVVQAEGEILPASSGTIGEPVCRHRGRVPRSGRVSTNSNLGPKLSREMKALPSNLGKAWEPRRHIFQDE